MTIAAARAILPRHPANQSLAGPIAVRRGRVPRPGRSSYPANYRPAPLRSPAPALFHVFYAFNRKPSGQLPAGSIAATRDVGPSGRLHDYEIGRTGQQGHPVDTGRLHCGAAIISSMPATHPVIRPPDRWFPCSCLKGTHPGFTLVTRPLTVGSIAATRATAHIVPFRCHPAFHRPALLRSDREADPVGQLVGHPAVH